MVLFLLFALNLIYCLCGGEARGWREVILLGPEDSSVYNEWFHRYSL